MRDTLKEKEYFDKYILYEESRISKFSKVAKEIIDERGQNDESIKKIKKSLFGFALNKFNAMYSRGDSKEVLTEEYLKLIEGLYEVSDIGYNDILWILSLNQLLLRQEGNQEKIVKITEKLGYKDLIIEFLLKGSVNKENQTLKYKEYTLLEKAIKCEDEEETLIYLESYLNEWYESHSGSYWYNSHLSKNDTYFGYWCYEVAAIYKLLNLCCEKIVLHKYFPKDLI